MALKGTCVSFEVVLHFKVLQDLISDVTCSTTVLSHCWILPGIGEELNLLQLAQYELVN